MDTNIKEKTSSVKATLPRAPALRPSVKEYNHNYYINHYKQIIANKKEFCTCCQVEVSSWNMYKHKNSKKHKYNQLSDEDKTNYNEQARIAKIQKYINKLEEKLEAEKKVIEKVF